MKNILVTGANGFIGQRLCKALLSSGYNLKKLVRVINPLDESEQYKCELENSTFPREAIENIDVIFHLAGLAHDTSESSFSEKQYHLVNVDATLRIATIAAKHKVKQFVFVSSVKAGGRPVEGCSDEDNQTDPRGVYASTKREAEIKLIELGLKNNIHITIIRPALVYGPNVGGNLKLMLSSINSGWFPPLPNLRNKRSMIHVDNLISAFVLIMNNQDAYDEIFIATDGIPYSSREIYEEMCKLLGKKIPSWSVPYFLFKLLAKISVNMKHKVNKLFEDECYSSKKLESIGFKPIKTLGDMNETNF
tara:strand:- start:557 stop:1474 length:918 start_codon:yes stop_codon:yes gene_type:complete